jgi:hypothetical protein
LDPIPVFELDSPLALRINTRELPIIGYFSYHLSEVGLHVEKVLLEVSFSKNYFLTLVDDIKDFFAIDLEHIWFDSITTHDKIRLIVSLRNTCIKMINNKLQNGSSIEYLTLKLGSLDYWKLVDIEYELLPR